MLPVSARFLLSAILIVASCLKLSLESSSKDIKGPGTHFILVDPGTTIQRAYRTPEENSAQELLSIQNTLEGLLQSNAGSAELWSTLGAMYGHTGKTAGAKHCYLRAAELAPNSAETVLSLAGYYINTDQVRRALPYLGRILESETQYSSTVIVDYDGFKLSFDEIVANGGMPRKLRVGEGYFRHLLDIQDSANARSAWNWLKPFSPSEQTAEDYAAYLVAHGSLSEAAAVWASQLGDRDPAGNVLDWKIHPNDHVRVTHDGASLRIAFDGRENLKYDGVSRRIFLHRGAYRLNALVRTSGITTDEGVGFRVMDVQAPNRVLLETSRLTGNHDSTKVEGVFAIDTPVKQVEVQFIRPASKQFENRIAGAAWIEHVSLKIGN